MSIVLASFVLLPGAGFLALLHHLFQYWRAQYSSRYLRSHPNSPSHHDLPNVVVPPKASKTRGKQRRSDDSRKSNSNHHQAKTLDAKRSNTWKPLKQCGEPKKDEDNKHFICPSEATASILDLDHIYMKFTWFAWFQLVVFPSFFIVGLFEFIKFQARNALVRVGLVKMLPFDPAEIVAKFALGSSVALYYKGRSDKNNDISIFEWHEIPILRQHDGCWVLGKNFLVEIDLVKKKLAHAELDGVELTPSECLTVIVFVLTALLHPIIHAAANWGINLEAEQQKANPDIHLAGLVSVGYNNLGATIFRDDDFTHNILRGVLSKRTGNMGLLKDQLRAHGIVEHSRVVELAAHSEFVRFLVGLRTKFLAEFAKHKDCCFPGCNGEALFAGTVVHSLEHLQAVDIIEDPLWIDVRCPKFGLMAEVIRLGRVSLTHDLPLPFVTKMKNSNHPFFQAVYAHAKKLDKKWADELDTCICR